MIKHVDYLVSDKKISVEDIFNSIPESDKLPIAFSTKEEGVSFYKESFGLASVSNAEAISEVDFFDAMMDKVFNAEIDPLEMDLIILIGDELSKGNRMPNFGHYIQHAYGFDNAEILVVAGNHCSNIEFAIKQGESLLLSGKYQNILIIGVNKFANHKERIIGTYAIQGDGVGIVHLNANAEHGVRILGESSFTNGILYEADIDAISPILLCKNYMICLDKLINTFNISPEEIAYIIIQNANYELISQCLYSLGFKENQILLENLNTYGHIDCVDFIINLKTILNKEMKPGTKIISFGQGWAGSNIGLYLEIV